MISDRDTSLLARSRNEMPTQWLNHDIMILVEGVNKYKSFVKKLFDYIYTDSLLKFKFRREVPIMKTKWRQLVSSGSVQEDGDR
jgi:exonuclease V gamma subunit